MSHYLGYVTLFVSVRAWGLAISPSGAIWVCVCSHDRRMGDACHGKAMAGIKVNT